MGGKNLRRDASGILLAAPRAQPSPRAQAALGAQNPTFHGLFWRRRRLNSGPPTQEEVARREPSEGEGLPRG